MLSLIRSIQNYLRARITIR